MPGIARKQVTSVFVDDGLPVLLATSELLVGNVYLDEVLGVVDMEHIAVPNEGDGSPIQGLRAEVAY